MTAVARLLRRLALLSAGMLMCFAPLAALVASADPIEIDLEGVVELALTRNRALKAVEERRAEVLGGIVEARADAWPQVAAEASWGRSLNPTLLNSPDFEEFIRDFPGGSFEPQVQQLSRLSVEVTQSLYTFGKIPAAISLAREVADAAEAQIETARLDTALAGAESYFGLLVAQQALATVKKQEQARRESLGVVEARFEIGEATRLELLQSQATLAQLLPDLSDAQGRVELARARLRQVLALESGDEIEVKPFEVDREKLREIPDLDALGEIARRRRPELRDLELQGRALGSRARVLAADGRPQVELTGRYGREARETENLTDPLFDDWAVEVGMRWEFFDGGRRRGEIARLGSRRRQLDLQLRELESAIGLEIEQTLIGYRTARARLEAAEVAATASVEAARVAEDSYREGVALQADLLTAQERETEAEILLVEAYFDALIQGARLGRALGLLPTEAWAAVAPLPLPAPSPTTPGDSRP